jgi:hypothetical protein
MDAAKLKNSFLNIDSPQAFTSHNALYRAPENENSHAEIKEFLKSQPVYTINRQVLGKFQRKPYQITNIGDLWSMDLVDLQNIEKHNPNYRYILLIIDSFSKMLYGEAISNKKADSIVQAFKHILKGKHCLNLLSDNGSEFTNKTFQDFLRKNGINHYTNVDDATHASVIERAIRTFKQRLYKYFHHNNTFKYIDVYKKIIDGYNNTYHSTIKMCPNQVNDHNIRKVYYNSQNRLKIKPENARHKVGAFVRIARKRGIFEKHSTGNSFSKEIFQIKRVIKHKIPMYVLMDLEKEEILGKFYNNELITVDFDPNAAFKIDKIIKKRRKNGIKQLFVSWEGWPPKFNSWINESDLIED